MGLRTYKATGTLITAVKTIFGVKLRSSGIESLIDRPTLFVVNHFTRFETFLIPYVLSQHTDCQIRSLAAHTLFKGFFGRYLRSVGVMSTRHPRRNRTIITELMTGRFGWVIYPEGGLIKNKKTVEKGRLRLSHPGRRGPPHTGAAMLAIKAEICKRRYLEACAQDDLRRIKYYEGRYGLTGPDEVSPQGTVIVPVTITYYPMRPGRNLLNRVARLLLRNLDPRIDEELQFEGKILLAGSDICVHLGEPIEVADYLDKSTELARRFLGMFSEPRRTNLFLRRQAGRLTDAFMRSIYNNAEINFDHLFCYGLRALKRDSVPAEDFHKALYLAALEFGEGDGLRVHPTLAVGDRFAGLLTGGPFEPLVSVVALARKAGVLRREGDDYVIDRDALQRYHDFHDIRLSNMVQVIANEFEAIEPAVATVKRLVNLSSSQLSNNVSRAIAQRDQRVFHREYTTWFNPESSRPIEFGEPFHLESPDKRVGVVLAHGYLASPEEIRPLATSLHQQGYSVYGVRLKGHGTAPRQLNVVGWEAWLDSLMQGYAVLRHACQQVVVGGFSLGGVLALLLAARRPEGVDAVFSINAPMKIRDFRAPLVPAIVRLNGAMRRLGLANGHYRRSNDRTESPDINYEVDYLVGVRELRRAVRACRKSLPQVTAPALIIQAEGDPLVGPKSATVLERRLGSRVKMLSRLESDRHVIVRGDGSEGVFDAIADFIREQVVDADHTVREVESDLTRGL